MSSCRNWRSSGGIRTEQICGERRSRPVGDLHHDSVVGVCRRAAEVDAGDAGKPDHEPHAEHRRGDADREYGAAEQACAFAVSQASLFVHGFGRSWVRFGRSAPGLVGGICEATV